MHQPQGPGSPFVCHFDGQDDAGLPLASEFRSIYGRWQLPHVDGRPYTYVNFVMSRDGRVSFNEPGKSSGGPISGDSRHDRWLMGLLRARADAVLVGASALAYAPRHIWTPAGVFPDDAAAWDDLRRAEGRPSMPLHVVVTRSGAMRTQSPVLREPKVQALIVSTDAGLERARASAGDAPNVRFLTMGERIDYPRLLGHLATEYGIRSLLSEAGPRVYGALLAAGVVDDEFVTLSPIIVGSSDQRPRPSLVEGVAFTPDDPPRGRLLSLRRAGDCLFLQSRYRRERVVDD